MGSIDTTEYFEDSFYNWAILNGIDVYVKGSEIHKSSITTPLLAEVHLSEVRDGIKQLLNKKEDTVELTAYRSVLSLDFDSMSGLEIREVLGDWIQNVKDRQKRDRRT